MQIAPVFVHSLRSIFVNGKIVRRRERIDVVRRIDGNFLFLFIPAGNEENSHTKSPVDMHGYLTRACPALSGNAARVGALWVQIPRCCAA